VITLLKSNAKLRAEFDAHVKDDMQRVTCISNSDDNNGSNGSSGGDDDAEIAMRWRRLEEASL
jgi:1,2-phenylacetyl-CoA epoxidase catalytic subunit